MNEVLKMERIDMKTTLTILSATLFVVCALDARAEDNKEAGPSAPPVQTISLAEAQDMATKNNPSLRNMDELVYLADTTINTAWSMLLPNLSANGAVIRHQREIKVGFPDFSTMQPSDPSGFLRPEDFGTMGVSEITMQEKWTKSFGFTANMTLFNPRSIPLIQNAYDNTDKTRLEVQRLKNDLLFAVTSAYYQAHSMQEMIRVWEENLKIAEEFKRQSEARLQAGQSTTIDVLRAEIQLMDAQKELANAEDAHEMAKTAIAYLIGIEGDFVIAGPEQVSSINDDLDTLKERALKERVDLKEATIAGEMAKRSKTETWMKWLPAFDVTYDWSWNSSAGFAGENDSWMLIFGAKWNLFEGGGRIAELKSRESQIRMTQNSYDQLSLDIRQEVEQSYLDVNKKQRNVEMAEKQVALAEENHKLVSRQYEVGLVPSLDLLNASTELANLRTTQVIERLQYDISLLALRRAVGEYHSLAAVSSR